MDQRSVADDFRTRLRAAMAIGEARARLDALAQLATDRLGFVETIQLDRALAATTAGKIEGYKRVRLALLSSSTTNHLPPAIRVAGLRRGLLIDVHAGAYGQYRQELLDPGTSGDAPRADLVLLSLTARDAIAGVPITASAAQADARLTETVADLRLLWRAARDRFGATVVQQTFLDVFDPLFGSYERFAPGSPARLVARLNDLTAEAARQDNVLLLDVAQASARDGIDAWHDVTRWLHAKMEIAPQASERYGDLVARLIAARLGRSRKCLVLDLDNTLWGGVVGDVGVAGLVLGEGSAQGEAHLALQRHARRLRERGVILAVCSKNDPEIAEQAFRTHPEMLLRWTDVAAFVANWNDKAENLRNVAEQLNIGLDSLVFLDDNPVERARIRESLPMVAVPEPAADPALFVRCLVDGGYFEAVSFTEDDARRGEQYAANVEREALRGAAQSMDDFLGGLQMSLAHGPVEAVDIARVAQLINKTNQFNTTGHRYSTEEVSKLAAAPENVVLQFRLADRFGDNGLVSAMVLRPDATDKQCLEIDVWVMSCRVFGRQLEDEAMNVAVEAARARGIETLRAGYTPTDRNRVIAGLFEKLGFMRQSSEQDSNATSRWTLRVADYVARPTFINRRIQSK